MLFKKILSFTMAAAVSSTMLMSAPASGGTSVRPADSDPFAFLMSSYAAEADGTDTEDNAVIGHCCACGKDLTKENFHIAASGAQSCFDCYPITVNCFPKSTRTVTDTVKKIELNDRDTGTIVFEHKGTYDLGMSDNFTRLNNKLGHVLKEGETIELCYYYEDVPEEIYYRDTPSIYNIVSFKSVRTIAAPGEKVETCYLCGKILTEGQWYEADDGLIYCENDLSRTNSVRGKFSGIVSEINTDGFDYTFRLSNTDKLFYDADLFEECRLSKVGLEAGCQLELDCSYYEYADCYEIRHIFDFKINDPETVTTTTTAPKITTTTTTTEYWERYALSVGSYPTKTEYLIGEELDFSGGSAMGFYENSSGVIGDVFSQPFTSEFYTIDDSEYDNTKPGTYTIYLKYGTASASYQVTVSAPDTTTTTTVTTTTTTTADPAHLPQDLIITGIFDHIADGYIYMSSGSKYLYSPADISDTSKQALADLKKGDNVKISCKTVDSFARVIVTISSVEVLDTDTTTTTTTTQSTVITTTTSDTPEQWMYGTGVDHFRSIKTLPTKTIYKEGEELDLSGLVIDAFHQVNRHSNKGNFESVVTDYIWEVKSIDPSYIVIEALNGETVSADDFSKLKGGNAYTVKFGSREVKLNVADEDREKEMYNADGFSFRVYISPADNTAEFTKIENVEVEKFLAGANGGVKLKGYDLFGIFMDEMLTPGYVMNIDLREGDKVNGVGYIDPATDSISLYDLEIVSYAGEKGDANGDGKVELADAILIMQSLANPNKYSLDGTDDHHLTERGHFHADLDGNGLTADDALEIQLHLLGKPSLLDK